jgi:hypothetical protein
MDRREEFQLTTGIHRILIEAGLDVNAVEDPTEALRGLARLGNPRAAVVLRKLEQLGWA